jgi:hypothetical protein
MVMQQETFDKIKSFVDREIDTGSNLVISNESRGGFRVNRFTIYPDGSAWMLEDPGCHWIQRFYSRKYAVLAAVLLNKRRQPEYRQLLHIDQQMAIASEDQQHYEKMLHGCSSLINENIYMARLSKARQVLENIRMQVKQLEKSVQLQ